MTIEKLGVPLSIVIAGGLIAGSLYFSNIKAAKELALLQKQQPATVVNAVAENMRPVSSDDHILGNPEAQVIIVEYSDTECPFCKSFHPTLQRVMSEYGTDGKVAWVYRNFPISQLHPKAPKEAEALECANELGGTSKFWEYTNAVYSTTRSNNSLDIGVYNTPKDPPKTQSGALAYTQKTPRSKTDAGQLSDIAKSVGLDVTAFESCLSTGKYTAKVQADYNDAIKAGGQGTPTSIFISKDGTKTSLQGAESYEVVKATIDALLQ
jgi:protein-disulfide isomerase